MQLRIKCAVCPQTKLVETRRRPKKKDFKGWESHVLYGLETAHTCSAQCREKLQAMVEQVESEKSKSTPVAYLN
jgi:hypothetical protein